MYEVNLYIHSWLRWLLLILCLTVVVRSAYGWIKKGEYLKGDNIISSMLTGLFHLQLILGLLLYFVLSPITEAALADFGNAMKDPVLRFWGIEHILVMILAITAAQMGRTKSKKAVKSADKFRIQTIYFLIALILVLSRIPWFDAHRLLRGISGK
jgi:hypothetical protein